LATVALEQGKKVLLVDAVDVLHIVPCTLCTRLVNKCDDSKIRASIGIVKEHFHEFGLIVLALNLPVSRKEELTNVLSKHKNVVVTIQNNSKDTLEQYES